MNYRTSLLLIALFGFLGISSPEQVLGATTAKEPVALPTSEFLNVTEALALAFPKCTTKRGTVYLTKEQKKQASKLAKVELEVGIVHPYEAFNKKGELVGTAYFDTHRVRAKKQSLMIVVAPDKTIARIELCAFGEPSDYIPSGRWYGQFLGKQLNDDLNLDRDIRGITGATLSAKSTTLCARRILALHEAIQVPVPTPKPEGPTGDA